MNMGNTASPWRYDAAARHVLQSASLRRPAILHYTSCAARLPDIAGWSGYPSIAAMPVNPGIDVMKAVIQGSNSALNGGEHRRRRHSGA
jgi:hypothetical protein